MKNFYQILKNVISKSFKSSIKVSWYIIKIYIPMSLLTIVLKRLGFIDYIAPFFSPIMKLMGLPGETAITLIAGMKAKQAKIIHIRENENRC